MRLFFVILVGLILTMFISTRVITAYINFEACSHAKSISKDHNVITAVVSWAEELIEDSFVNGKSSSIDEFDEYKLISILNLRKIDMSRFSRINDKSSLPNLTLLNYEKSLLQNHRGIPRNDISHVVISFDATHAISIKLREINHIHYDWNIKLNNTTVYNQGAVSVHCDWHELWD